MEDVQVFLPDASAGTLTDAAGAYRLDLPGPGTFTVRIAGAGLAPDSATVRVSPDAPVARTDFTIRAAPPCAGPCHDARGNPIACC